MYRYCPNGQHFAVNLHKRPLGQSKITPVAVILDRLKVRLGNIVLNCPIFLIIFLQFFSFKFLIFCIVQINNIYL